MSVPNPAQLIAEFVNEYLSKHGVRLQIQHRLSLAGSGHIGARITPPTSESWVYVFSTTTAAQCPAGPGKALRVGRTASFGRLSQHYGAAGTTAKALVQQLSTQYFHWSYLGLGQIAPNMNNSIGSLGWKNTWGNWVKNNLDRDLFVLPTGNPGAISELEKFLRGRLAPVFEG